MLRCIEQHRPFNESHGGCTEHHATGWSDRLHPLRDADLLADRGVTQSFGTYFTGDYLARVQSDSHPQLHAVTVFDVDGLRRRLFLDV